MRYNHSCVEKMHGFLAQLAEHLTLNQGVQGSNPWWRITKYRFYSIGYGVGAFFMFEFKFKILKKITKSSQKNQHSPLDSANEQVYNVVRTKEEGTKEKERFPEFPNLLVPKKQG